MNDSCVPGLNLALRLRESAKERGRKCKKGSLIGDESSAADTRRSEETVNGTRGGSIRPGPIDSAFPLKSRGAAG